MVEAERQYWVRTEQGIVWGPYPRGVLERLRGRLKGRCDVSTDGKDYRPTSAFPEVAEMLGSAEAAPMAAAPPPEPGRAAVLTAEAPLGKLPEEGDLARASVLRLYALAAESSATGWLQITTPEERLLQISFRRGAPEHVMSDDPELGVFRFLVDSKAISAQEALRAEEHRARSGIDAVSALFQLQLIPPADAHRVLGAHALFVLDRALSTWRGKFTFESDAPSPPGAFPLGAKWTLLADASRRLDAATVRARLGRKMQRRVQRSGGNGVGRLEELTLNAQEARLFGSIDGTRTGDELIKGLPDQALGLRMLHLLAELGHLSFDSEEVAPRSTQPKPLPAQPSVPPPRAEATSVLRAASVPPPSRFASIPTPPRTAPIPTPPRPVTIPPAARFTPPTSPQRMAPSQPLITPPQLLPAVPQKPAPVVDVSLAGLRATLAKLEQSDHFAALGLDRKSALADARRAFFQLAREYHPDTVTEGSPPEVRSLKESIFARINEAASALSDETRRKAYEAELDGQAQNVDVGNIFAAEDAFQRAEIIIKARKYAEGLALLEEAIKLNPDEGEFYAWRGWAHFMLAKERRVAHAEAVAGCKKALQMSPLCAPAWLFQAQMAKILGDLKTAESCFKKVLELDANHLEAIRELRYLYPGKKS